MDRQRVNSGGGGLLREGEKRAPYVLVGGRGGGGVDRPSFL